MAYYQLEPFGSPADDDRFRVLTTNVIAPHMRSGSDIPVFFDRDPKPKIEDDDPEGIFAFLIGQSA